MEIPQYVDLNNPLATSPEKQIGYTQPLMCNIIILNLRSSSINKFGF